MLWLIPAIVTAVVGAQSDDPYLIIASTILIVASEIRNAVGIMQKHLEKSQDGSNSSHTKK